MIRNLYKTQIRYIFQTPIYQCVFSIWLIFTMIHFIHNVIAFYGWDTFLCYDPMKILLLSYNSSYIQGDYTLLLIQFFPVLVSMAAGMALATQRQQGMRLVLCARCGTFTYLTGSMIAVFVATSLVFLIPAFMEILANIVAFPITAVNDGTLLWPYGEDYYQGIGNYWLPELYKKSSILYAICGSTLFGLLSGLLGCVTAAFSLLCDLKFRVIYILPVMALLNATESILPRYFPQYSNYTGWHHYFLLYNDGRRATTVFTMCCLVCFLFVIISILISYRRDILK